MIKSNLVVEFTVKRTFVKLHHDIAVGKVTCEFRGPDLFERSSYNENLLDCWALVSLLKQIDNVPVIHDGFDRFPIAIGLIHEALVAFEAEVGPEDTPLMDTELRPEESTESDGEFIGTDASQPVIDADSLSVIPIL